MVERVELDDEVEKLDEHVGEGEGPADNVVEEAELHDVVDELDDEVEKLDEQVGDWEGSDEHHAGQSVPHLYGQTVVVEGLVHVWNEYHDQQDVGEGTGAGQFGEDGVKAAHCAAGTVGEGNIH